MNKVSVVVVVATLNRQKETARLIESLVPSAPALAGIIVVDNGRSLQLEQILVGCSLSIEICRPEQNLGCGGGLNLGMKTAVEKFGGKITHFLLLDDDAVLPPDGIISLVERGRAADAEIVYPMVVNDEGRIGWFPGLRSPIPWKVIRRVQTPGEYLRTCGPQPVPFSWSPGVCLLISENAVRKVGFPATDFWVRGEDLEYSLRVTSQFRSAFIPDVIVQHLVTCAGSADRSGELLKHLAMLQNITYMATRLPYGRRLLRSLPGNVFRFFRSNGFSLSNLKSLCVAFWMGVFKGKPAGFTGCNIFQKRYAELAKD